MLYGRIQWLYQQWVLLLDHKHLPCFMEFGSEMSDQLRWPLLGTLAPEHACWVSVAPFRTLPATAHLDLGHFIFESFESNVTPAFLCVFFHPDTWAEIVIPETSIAVIKGEMVVLKVMYRTEQSHDLNTDTILWNFVSNKTQLVRFC